MYSTAFSIILAVQMLSQLAAVVTSSLGVQNSVDTSLMGKAYGWLFVVSIYQHYFMGYFYPTLSVNPMSNRYLNISADKPSSTSNQFFCHIQIQSTLLYHFISFILTFKQLFLESQRFPTWIRWIAHTNTTIWMLITTIFLLSLLLSPFLCSPEVFNNAMKDFLHCRLKRSERRPDHTSPVSWMFISNESDEFTVTISKSATNTYRKKESGGEKTGSMVVGGS